MAAARRAARLPRIGGETVHHKAIRLQNRRKARIRRETHFVHHIVMRNAMGVWNMLAQRAAQRHIDHLMPPADSQHGQLGGKRHLEQIHLHFVALRVDYGRGMHLRFAKAPGRDIRPTGKEHAIQLVYQRAQHRGRRVEGDTAHFAARAFDGLNVFLGKELLAFLISVGGEADLRLVGRAAGKPSFRTGAATPGQPYCPNNSGACSRNWRKSWWARPRISHWARLQARNSIKCKISRAFMATSASTVLPASAQYYAHSLCAAA